MRTVVKWKEAYRKEDSSARSKCTQVASCRLRRDERFRNYESGIIIIILVVAEGSL